MRGAEAKHGTLIKANRQMRCTLEKADKVWRIVIQGIEAVVSQPQQCIGTTYHHFVQRQESQQRDTELVRLKTVWSRKCCIHNRLHSFSWSFFAYYMICMLYVVKTAHSGFHRRC